MPRKPRVTIVSFHTDGVEDALSRFIGWAGIPIKDIQNLGPDEVTDYRRFVVPAELWEAYVREVTKR